MPRSRKGVPRPAPEPDDEGEEEAEDFSEWGVAPEAEEDDGQLGEPPPMAVPAEPAVPPSKGLQDLGRPPMDTLAAEKWAHSVLMLQAYETMMSELPETVRRREVRTILRDARGHVTDAARYDYMRLVERDREELENHKRGRAAGRAEAVGAPPEGAKIIPLIPPPDE